jgi:hypothetical protein
MNAENPPKKFFNSSLRHEAVFLMNMFGGESRFLSTFVVTNERAGCEPKINKISKFVG